MGERTGSRVLRWVWSYVAATSVGDAYNNNLPTCCAVLWVPECLPEEGLVLTKHYST
ncbi:hypothetical protein LX36DRAFT_251947 [Colletotrichum falcatum]|nr:hypothetical protein LX36DRAFT_251947 [Colletotrichum falcatum]